MATTYLSHTMSTPTARTKSTISAWVKKTSEGANSTIFGGGDAATDCAFLNFNTSDKLFLQSATSDSADWGITTDAVFRDSSAWYHVVAKIDTTQSTSTDRVKIYVNGNLQTVTGSYPSQNYDMQWSRNGEVQLVGKYPSTGIYFNGLMAHVHFTDGYAYDASTFGQTDSTSGIWVPKTAPSVTYGTNGFFLKFENRGAMGTDSAGQSNTFTTSGTLTQTVDTPSNNFGTLNSAQPNHVGVPTNGNLTYANPSSGQRHIPSTLAVSSGKWYVEVKCNVVGGDYPQVGIFDTDIAFDTATYIGSTANGYGLSSTGHIWNSNSQQVNTGTTWTTGDILGIALDLTNDKIYWHKNGTYVSNGTGTGNPSTGTNGYSITADKTWYFTNSSNGAGGSPSFSFNFGSGYFGTTQVSSSNADANGHGLMEYAVPTGFYTLNTKNIKEFG